MEKYNCRPTVANKSKWLFMNKITSIVKHFYTDSNDSKIHDDTQPLRLSNHDRDLVLNLLNNPPKPNEKLKALMQGYDSKFIF